MTPTQPEFPKPATPDLPPEESLPEEMKKRERWVLWRYELAKQGWTKVPVNPYSLQKASTIKPATWGAFDFVYLQALKHRPNVSGIGFVVGDGIFGIDLDKCVEEGRVTTSVAREILARFKTYAEYSPSGKGLHLYGLGQYPPGAKLKTRVEGQAIECFDNQKFLTITGRRVPNSPEAIVDQQETLLAWHRDVFGETLPPVERNPVPAGVSRITDVNYIALLEQSAKDIAEREQEIRKEEDFSILCAILHSAQREKFVKLFKLGDMSEFKDDSHDGIDHSAADYALLGILVYWTQDAAQLDRLFRMSALCRTRERIEKWNRPRQGVPLGLRMIEKILESYRRIEASKA